METSRIIRVCARIVAVSQENALVCITRKVTRPENDVVLVLTSKLAVVKIDVISVWGIGVDLLSV